MRLMLPPLLLSFCSEPLRAGRAQSSDEVDVDDEGVRPSQQAQKLGSPPVYAFAGAPAPRLNHHHGSHGGGGGWVRLSPS